MSNHASDIDMGLIAVRLVRGSRARRVLRFGCDGLDDLLRPSFGDHHARRRIGQVDDIADLQAGEIDAVQRRRKFSCKTNPYHLCELMPAETRRAVEMTEIEHRGV